jgi:hypothetical protein
VGGVPTYRVEYQAAPTINKSSRAETAIRPTPARCPLLLRAHGNLAHTAPEMGRSAFDGF